MTVEQIQSLTKMQQYELLQAIRPHIKVSMADIARRADVSPTLVSYVFQGINSNPKVLAIILENLSQGWENSIPAQIQLQVA
jgi:transcriptional regulator with XRE-family HTH domain